MCLKHVRTLLWAYLLSGRLTTEILNDSTSWQATGLKLSLSITFVCNRCFYSEMYVIVKAGTLGMIMERLVYITFSCNAQHGMLFEYRLDQKMAQFQSFIGVLLSLMYVPLMHQLHVIVICSICFDTALL